MVDIADLSLQPFNKVKKKIKAALRSEKAWERYWALIVCSSFGKQASPFYRLATKVAEQDSENLVRMRAAEFLALTAQQAPQAILVDCLKKAKSHTRG